MVPLVKTVVLDIMVAVENVVPLVNQVFLVPLVSMGRPALPVVLDVPVNGVMLALLAHPESLTSSRYVPW